MIASGHTSFADGTVKGAIQATDFRFFPHSGTGRYFIDIQTLQLIRA